MHTEISSLLVKEHHLRLREAAQAPAMPLVARLWALLRRRDEPVAPIKLSARELERLAA